MSERFKVVFTMQGAIQVLSFTFTFYLQKTCRFVVFERGCVDKYPLFSTVVYYYQLNAAHGTQQLCC